MGKFNGDAAPTATAGTFYASTGNKVLIMQWTAHVCWQPERFKLKPEIRSARTCKFAVGFCRPGPRDPALFVCVIRLSVFFPRTSLKLQLKHVHSVKTQNINSYNKLNCIQVRGYLKRANSVGTVLAFWQDSDFADICFPCVSFAWPDLAAV